MLNILFTLSKVNSIKKNLYLSRQRLKYCFYFFLVYVPPCFTFPFLFHLPSSFRCLFSLAWFRFSELGPQNMLHNAKRLKIAGPTSPQVPCFCLWICPRNLSTAHPHSVTSAMAPSGRWLCHRRGYRRCVDAVAKSTISQTASRHKKGQPAASMKATPAKARTQLLIEIQIHPQIYSYRYSYKDA